MGEMQNKYVNFGLTEIGFKYKISNIQASIGCAQMERIEELNLKKTRNS